jgi:hypothetical protein
MEVVLALHLYGIPWPLLRPSNISRKRKDGWNQELFPRLRVLLPGWSGQLKEQRGALTAVPCWPGVASAFDPFGQIHFGRT